MFSVRGIFQSCWSMWRDGRPAGRNRVRAAVTGVLTSGGVEATARQAYERGFNVTLAIDAMTDIREEAHQYSITNVLPRVGETGSTKEIISLLERLWKERNAAS
jgi:nicotinamidase-related amidase